MQEEKPTIDEQMTAIDERVKRIQKLFPLTVDFEGVDGVGRGTVSRDPLKDAQMALGVSLFIICMALIGVVQRIVMDPPTDVVVSAEEGEFQVWTNVSKYEASTGKMWSEQIHRTLHSRVPFHGAQKAVSEEVLPPLILVALLLLYAHRKVRGVRRESHPVPKPSTHQQ